MRRGRSIGFAFAAAGLLALFSGCSSEEAQRKQAEEDQKFKPPVPDKPPPVKRGTKGPAVTPGPNVKGRL